MTSDSAASKVLASQLHNIHCLFSMQRSNQCFFGKCAKLKADEFPTRVDNGQVLSLKKTRKHEGMQCVRASGADCPVQYVWSESNCAVIHLD